MNERDVRAVLLVRAWETAPPGTVAWSDEDRRQTTWAAARADGEAGTDEAGTDEVFIVRRARLALERIGQRDPRAPRLLGWLDERRWLPWALAAIALASGILVDAFGASQQINLLAPPLIGLIGWNLAIYASLAFRGGAIANDLVQHLVDSRWRKRLRSRLERHPDPGARDALRRFAADHIVTAAPLQAARIALGLHLSAITFVAGALAGMYIRGLAFAYRAGWESTFLDASQVRAILGLVLGPASAITGIPLPDPTALEAMRLPGPGADAAPWIHLYAVTAVIVVLLPRTALLVCAWRRARRLAGELPLSLDAPYFAALLRARRGRQAHLLVLPWGQRPGPAASRTLQAMANRLEIAGAQVSISDPVPYGDESAAGEALAKSDAPALILALLPAIVTPESEIHGEFIDRIIEACGPKLPVVVLIDESSFVARLGSDLDAGRRLDQRRSAWQRLLTGRGGTMRDPLFVNLERDDPAVLAQAVHEHAQPGHDSAMLPR